MTTRMLGKVVAGAALGGASLLAFTPGIALADVAHGGGEGHRAKGKVYADPHVVKPGHDVKLIEVCAEPQEHAYVWSKVTGKVKLHPRQHDKGGKDRDWRSGQGTEEQPGRGTTGRTGENGPGWENGRGEQGRGEQGRGENGQAENGRGEEGRWPGQDAAEGENEQGRRPGQERPGTPQQGAEQRGAQQKDAENGERREPDAMNQSEAGGQGGGDNSTDQGKGKEQKDEYGKDGQPMDTDAAESGRHGAKFVYYGQAEIPWNAKPGTYELKGSCGEGRLIVMPKGHVDGGDGGAGSNDLATSGAAMLGAAALGGIVLMRRRRAHESLV